jgi:hypothetical protein
MGCQSWPWLTPYIRRWGHVIDKYTWHISIGGVASPMNIRGPGLTGMTCLTDEYRWDWKPHDFISLFAFGLRRHFAFGPRGTASHSWAAHHPPPLVDCHPPLLNVVRPWLPLPGPSTFGRPPPAAPATATHRCAASPGPGRLHPALAAFGCPPAARFHHFFQSK